MPHGGMDRANYALAVRLASTGHEVHLVTHRAAESLRQCGAFVHRAARPANAHAAGMPLLAREARRRAAQFERRKPCVVANGGNCVLPSVNWVHYVHAAYDPATDVPGGASVIARLQRRYVLRHERGALSRASAVICNSERTRRDVVERLDVPEAIAHVIYYGIDPCRFTPPSPAARTAARAALGVVDGRPVVLFVGALGDRRKGFDALFGAWTAVWRRELRHWRARAEQAGVAAHLHFLGFREDVHVLLAAADVLVHPARYEAYGLSVHEAICAGVPAIVSAGAGVAERYPGSLRGLLLPEVSEERVAAALEFWRGSRSALTAAAEATGTVWRARTWDHMADEIIALASRT
jgi:glycosyltransferase involved in cell wall biosynthesis